MEDQNRMNKLGNDACFQHISLRHPVLQGWFRHIDESASLRGDKSLNEIVCIIGFVGQILFLMRQSHW